MGLPVRRSPFQQTRRIPIYAIVRTGGKQYRVETDQVLDIDRIQAEVGSTVELKDVLMLGGGNDVQVGTPIVDGATVVAEVLEHGRDKKILVFKYKNKTRYRRRFGHRQDFTRLAIRQILADGKAVEAEVKPTRPARKKPAPKAEKPVAEAAEVTAAAPVDEPAMEAAPPEAAQAPKPRRAGAAKPRAAKAAAAQPDDAAEAPKPKRTRAARPKAEKPAEAQAEEKPEGE
ncbi:MAG TPA: 50S ribosomal protein L21 [Dehalococcoidia bacterium]|nr:50S ribosomal protein L21 [Dehalococcoidia bacterium]